MDTARPTRRSRSPVPVDAEAPSRVLGGSCIVLTAMGFLSVTLSFDPVAARHAMASHGAGIMAAAREPAPALEARTPEPAVAPRSPMPETAVVPWREAPVVAPMNARAPEAEPRSHAGPDSAQRPARNHDKPRARALPRATPEDEVMVKAAIAKRMTALSRCYERALLRSPRLSGKLSVRVEVAPDGHVVSARVRRDTLRDPWLATCTTDRIEGWRLPHLQDDASVVVTIPVTFVR